MKLFFKRIRTSTFVRFAVSYLLMLTIVLSCVFTYLIVYVRRDVLDKTLDGQINRLGRIADQHEHYLTSMMDSAVQLGLSPAIQPFAYEEAPERAYDLQRQMAPYAVTNSFCELIYLTFHGEDHIYSSNSSMTVEDFLKITRYERIAPEDLRAMIQAPGALTILPAQQVGSPLISVNSTDIVTFLMSLGGSTAASKGTMIFMVPAQAYRQLFADAVDAAENTYILHDGAVMVSQQEFDVPADVVLQAIAAGCQAQSFQWNGEDWRILCHHSDGWDLTYASLLRMADVEHIVGDKMTSVMIMAALMTALGVLAALLLAQRHAKPIRQIASMLPKNNPTEDAFASIQTGIQELNARNTDLTTRLESSLPMQRHDFVLRFMKGRYADRAEAVAAAESIRLNIDHKYYAVILHGVQERADHQPIDMRRPPFDQVAGTEVCAVELMAIKAHLYLVFSDTMEAIRALAMQIHHYGVERNGHAVVALSDVQTDFAAAPGAYLEAATAFDNRFVMDDGALLDYSSVSTNIEDILPQARKITDSIHQALSLRNHAMLEGRVDELLHFLKHTSMSPFAFRLIYNDVIDKLLRRHTQTIVSGRSVQTYYDIFTLSSCQSIDDLDTLLRRLCVAIMDAPQQEQDIPDQVEAPSIISQVSAYIREHFADPELSISAIAEAFDMPTARLSLAFKEEMNVSPLEYLTLLRVEQSKELLRGTELSIKDIATQVGYYDASSFIRRFKQMTGVTPLQYRRSKENSDHA